MKNDSTQAKSDVASGQMSSRYHQLQQLMAAQRRKQLQRQYMQRYVSTTRLISAVQKGDAVRAMVGGILEPLSKF